MRYGFRRLLAMLLAAMLCVGAAGAEGYYEESVTDLIRLYPQHRQRDYQDVMCIYLCAIPLKVTDKKSTMCTSGCMIWAFVHAVEWCRQEKLYTNEAGNLVKEFVRANNAPWDVQFVIDDCYHNVVRAHEIEVLPAPPETEEEMIAFVHKTGSVVCNMGGHCTVAMGYTYYDYDGDGDEDMMIHMLDSALWSSVVKQTIYDFETFKHLEFTTRCEGEFWLPFDVYVTLDRLAMVPVSALAAEE